MAAVPFDEEVGGEGGRGEGEGEGVTTSYSKNRPRVRVSIYEISPRLKGPREQSFQGFW